MTNNFYWTVFSQSGSKYVGIVREGTDPTKDRLRQESGLYFKTKDEAEKYLSECLI